MMESKLFFCNKAGCFRTHVFRNGYDITVECPDHLERFVSAYEKEGIEKARLKEGFDTRSKEARNALETGKEFVCLECLSYFEAEAEGGGGGCPVHGKGSFVRVSEVLDQWQKEYDDEIKNLDIGSERYKTELDAVVYDKVSRKNARIQAIFTRWLMEREHFIAMNDTDELYIYENGYYVRNAEKRIGEFVQRKMFELGLLEYAYTNLVVEVAAGIKRLSYVGRRELNPERYVTLENGVYDVIEQKFSKFSPNIYNTQKIPVRYEEGAGCEEFEKFVSEIVDERDVDLIQEMFGYCLLKDYRFHNIFMFWGTGANGKSVLLNVLVRMLGEENISSIALQAFDENRFSRAQLEGKLANIHGDLNSKALSNTGMLKMLSGEDVIEAEKKHKDLFKFRNFAKMIYSCNMLPASPDDSNAFYRRMIVVTFPRTFDEDEQDHELGKRLCQAKEMSGVFNWAVKGLARLMEKQKFSYRIDVLEERRKLYVRRSDPVKAFVEEECEIDSEGVVYKDSMYEVFIQYAKANRFVAPNDVVFAKRFKAACVANDIPVRTERGREGDSRKYAWVGIRFKRDEEKDEEVEFVGVKKMSGNGKYE